MSEYIESLTMYASNACTEVLSGIEHQLERTLQGPCEKVAEKVARAADRRERSIRSEQGGWGHSCRARLAAGGIAGAGHGKGRPREAWSLS